MLQCRAPTLRRSHVLRKLRFFSKEAHEYLSSKLQLPDKLNRDQRARLFDAILQNLKPVYGPEINTSHLEGFSSGLQPLADSLLSSETSLFFGGPTIQLPVRLPRGNGQTTISWSYQDQTLLQAIQNSEDTAEFIEATCSGNASCCTCHVYITHNNQVQLPTISEEEQDMLDYAPDLRSSSRLACQVKVCSQLDDKAVIEVALPDETNNLWK